MLEVQMVPRLASSHASGSSRVKSPRDPAENYLIPRGLRLPQHSQDIHPQDIRLSTSNMVSLDSWSLAAFPPFPATVLYAVWNATNKVKNQTYQIGVS
ncbi:hypothetical protein B0H67DRAFT_239851 [Lasiosphaeris hirsuta]|uniref:Uncharacterized protein n=1 Tax=Lasiosphaeris hirsuta TaxID=260670 RepID=A0AA40DWA3_9PEZI|nr:hypothetical protein B0H67DRAFT_239851 [Lasiosphaeris hirsuta]